MMLKNKKKKITIILLAATVCLWGVILYNVFYYYTSSGEEEPDVIIENENVLYTPVKKNLENEEAVFYEEIVRDPFVFRKKIAPVPEEEITPEVFTPPPPPEPKLNYQINGTIINASSKLVIFEDRTNNKTLFLREGETYNGIKITSIGIDKIKVVEDHEVKEIEVRK
ncbi:MAG: hypothetical protein R6W90_03520 [Ignavibacteriaceae bacterium]